MSLISLCGASASFFLPETLGQRLPETLAEAREFGRGQKFWGIPESNIKPTTTNEYASQRTGPEKTKDEKLNLKLTPKA